MCLHVQEQKVRRYFEQLDIDGDGLITRPEFSNAVSTEMWAGMLVRSFSRPVAAPQPAIAASTTIGGGGGGGGGGGVSLGARQASVGLVRTKSALSRSHGMSRDQIDAIQRLLPMFYVPDLQRLLETLRQRSSSLVRTKTTIPGAEFKTILAKLIPSTPDAPVRLKTARFEPHIRSVCQDRLGTDIGKTLRKAMRFLLQEMARLSAMFFSYLFDRADAVATESGGSSPDFAEFFGMLVRTNYQLH